MFGEETEHTERENEVFELRAGVEDQQNQMQFGNNEEGELETDGELVESEIEDLDCESPLHVHARNEILSPSFIRRA